MLCPEATCTNIKVSSDKDYSTPSLQLPAGALPRAQASPEAASKGLISSHYPKNPMVTFRKVTLEYFTFRKVVYLKKRQKVWILLETCICILLSSLAGHNNPILRTCSKGTSFFRANRAEIPCRSPFAAFHVSRCHCRLWHAEPKPGNDLLSTFRRSSSISSPPHCTSVY